MKVIISGASGLVGGELSYKLQAMGHEVIPLVRRKAQVGEIEWDPRRGVLPVEPLEAADAVIHLAGENIAEGRWTEAKKQRIRESRVQGTQLLSDSLARLESGPKIFISASAIGYYGDRAATVMDESSAAGQGYLSDVCQQWEEATQTAEVAGLRVLRLRIGVVLSRKGGALTKMLPPFKLGIGGILGDGQQYMSWIDLNDLVDGIYHLLTDEQANGIYNMVAPNAVTNEEFTKTLGRVLRRPTIFPMPAFAARLAFGEMADALLLASTRVTPARLLHSSYQFQYASLAESLHYQLRK